MSLLLLLVLLILLNLWSLSISFWSTESIFWGVFRLWLYWFRVLSISQFVKALYRSLLLRSNVEGANREVINCCNAYFWSSYQHFYYLDKKVLQIFFKSLVLFEFEGFNDLRNDFRILSFVWDFTLLVFKNSIIGKTMTKLTRDCLHSFIIYIFSYIFTWNSLNLLLKHINYCFWSSKCCKIVTRSYSIRPGVFSLFKFIWIRNTWKLIFNWKIIISLQS